MPVSDAALACLAAMTGTLTVLPLLAGWGSWTKSAVYTLALAFPLSIALKIGQPPYLPRLGLRAPTLSTALSAGALGLFFWPINSLISIPLAIHCFGAESFAHYSNQIARHSTLYQLVALVLLPALLEELLFRGALCRAIAQRWGNWPAVWLSAAAFALLHLPLVRIIPVFVFGLVLGGITVRSSSIIPSMLAHLSNNLGALWLAQALRPAFSSHGFALTFVATTGCSLALVAFLRSTKTPS